MKQIIIRSATRDDAVAILDIYGYYVANTAISMEYDVPSMAEFEKRIETTLENYPYLVAEQDGKSIMNLDISRQMQVSGLLQPVLLSMRIMTGASISSVRH